MTTNDIVFKPTITFTQGYLKPELLREYLLTKGGLKANDFMYKSTARQIDLMLIKNDPNFDKTHRDAIEEVFKQAERDRNNKNLKDMEEDD